MTEALLGLTLPGVAFDVALHVATLVSVVIVYRERLLRLARGAAVRSIMTLTSAGFPEVEALSRAGTSSIREETSSPCAPIAAATAP